MTTDKDLEEMRKMLEEMRAKGPPAAWLVDPLDMPALSFTVTGTPRSKKNGARIVTRPFPKLLPSKAWCDWRDTCELWVRSDLTGLIMLGPLPVWGGDTCNCAATFYVDSMRRIDANNLYSGLADLLQHHGVVDDDACIIAWDGSRVYLDRGNPRTEVVLTPMAPTLVDQVQRKRGKRSGGTTPVVKNTRKD